MHVDVCSHSIQKEGLLSNTRVLTTSDTCRLTYPSHHILVVNIATPKTRLLLFSVLVNFIFTLRVYLFIFCGENHSQCCSEYKPSEGLDVVIADCISNLIKLGLYLSAVPKEGLATALDGLHEQVPELLCSQAMMEFFLRTDDVDSGEYFSMRICIIKLSAKKYILISYFSTLFAVNDYLSRYDGTISIVSDNDVVWPHPVRLFPYE